MFTLGISALDVTHLRVASQENPVCIDATQPDFSWQIQSDDRGVLQTSYRIVVSSDAEGGMVVWDSGTVESDQSVGIVSTSITLNPSTRYYWRVTVTDNKGNEATSSETAYFETGLMKSGAEHSGLRPPTLPMAMLKEQQTRYSTIPSRARCASNVPQPDSVSPCRTKAISISGS